MIRKEKLLRELTALQSSLPELERWTEILRCIERPIWMDSCTLLIKFLREVQADIQPLNGALESFSLEKEPEFEPLKINGGYLWQLADDIILRLVVYRPHSRLVTKVYLKQRRSIATDMQHLIEAMKLMVLPNSLSAQEWRASSLLSLVEVHQEEDQAGEEAQG